MRGGNDNGLRGSLKLISAHLRVDIVREEVSVRPPVHELGAVAQRGLGPRVDDGRVLALAGSHALLLLGAHLVAREARAEAAGGVQGVAAGVAVAAVGGGEVGEVGARVAQEARLLAPALKAMNFRVKYSLNKTEIAAFITCSSSLRH